MPAVRFTYSIDRLLVTNTVPSPRDSEGRSLRRARTLIRRADRNAGSRNQIPTRIRPSSRSVVNMSPGSMGASASRFERSFPVVFTGESVRTMIYIDAVFGDPCDGTQDSDRPAGERVSCGGHHGDALPPKPTRPPSRLDHTVLRPSTIVDR